jgi:hypothetical protein
MKVRVFALALAVAFSGNLALSVHQTASAADWSDIIRPLVNDVLIPSATKLIQAHQKNAAQAVTSTITTEPVITVEPTVEPTTTSSDEEVITIPPSSAESDNTPAS